MTITEQIIEWALTHGTGAIAGVGSALVTAWAGRRRAAARTEEAIAATVEQSLKREAKLVERVEQLEAQAVERAATNATLADVIEGMRGEVAACHASREAQAEIIDRHERRMRRWERLLGEFGISIDDDSGDAFERLGRAISDAAAHRAANARIARLEEQNTARRAGEEG